jgi:hypothetical protein
MIYNKRDSHSLHQPTPKTSILQQYIKSRNIMNKQQQMNITFAYQTFERFILSKYGSNINLDRFVEGLREGIFDIYQTLRDYCVYYKILIFIHLHLNNVLYPQRIF